MCGSEFCITLNLHVVAHFYVCVHTLCMSMHGGILLVCIAFEILGKFFFIAQRISFPPMVSDQAHPGTSNSILHGR